MVVPFLYCLLGVLTGLLSGILGIGGGVIVVPGLLLVFAYNGLIPATVSMHVAAASSLTVMIFTSLASLRAHHRMGEILWDIYWRLAAGIVLGTILGVMAAELLPTHWLKILFAIFLLAVALKMALGIASGPIHHFPKAWMNRCISTLIGFKSGLFGVGGGILVVPYLTYCGVDVRKIPAISGLCTLTVALIGTGACTVVGSHPAMPAYSTGYVYWPAVAMVALTSCFFAPIGAYLSYRLPVRFMRRLFIMILILTACMMLKREIF